MKWRPSIRLYLALVLGLLVLLVLGASALIWYRNEEQLAEDALRTQLQERALLLATLSRIDQLAGQFAHLPTTYAAVDSNLSVTFVTTDLEILKLSDIELDQDQASLILDLSQSALNGLVASREVYGSEGPDSETLYAAAPVFGEDGEVIGAVCLFLPLRDFEATMVQSRTRLLLTASGAAFLCLLIGVIIATVLTQPLAKAQRLAAQVASGDYDLRLPERGPREIAELAHHLNHMAEELQKQRRARELVLANMTHELARPLGGLRLGVDSLKGGALDEPLLADDLLIEMGQSLQRMEALIEDLALAARPTTNPVRLNLAPVPLESMIHGMKSRFWTRAEGQGIRLTVNLPETLPPVEADELRLYQILANLVDNALKYTPTGGEVTITAECVEDTVRLIVRDTGPGIDPAEMKRVLEPFTQGVNNVARIHQGMGLGLSIVQQLTTAHGGEFRLSNIETGGLEASVTIPLSHTG